MHRFFVNVLQVLVREFSVLFLKMSCTSSQNSQWKNDQVIFTTFLNKWNLWCLLSEIIWCCLHRVDTVLPVLLSSLCVTHSDLLSIQSDIILPFIFTTSSSISCCSVLFLCSGIFWDTDACQIFAVNNVFISTVAILGCFSTFICSDCVAHHRLVFFFVRAL